MSIIETLLDDTGVDPDEVADDGTRNAMNQTVSREHEIDDDEVEPPEPPTTFDLPPFGQEQFDLLTSVDLTQGNPETGERESVFRVELEVEDDDGEPLDDETATFDVSVTDHLGTDPFDAAPNDGLGGSATVEFSGGEGSFTIGGADSDDADLTLGFLGSLPEVNDVETIDIDAPDDVEIVDRTLELDENSGSTAVEAEWTETIEER